MAGLGRGKRGLAALGAIVALVLTGLVAVGVHSRSSGGTAQAAGEIYLAPASSTGSNPFTASLMTPAAAAPATAAPAPVETPPIAAGAGAGAQAPSVNGGAAPQAGASTQATPSTATTTVDGSVPQLYGGQMGVNRCDEHILVRQLDGDGDLARAWADSEGIDVDALHDFAGGLVSVDLLDDVRVTDWHRVDGRGSAVQVVLERGTTVLVDRYGVPRVRCLSGDPLTSPDQVRTDARFVGPHWDGFRPASLIVIVPATRVLPTLVLLETSTGKPFGRRIEGEKADIDSDTLVADQDRLGVQVSVAAPPSPDATEDVRLSPAAGPPGSTIFAIGTGWPVGDRIRIEPCVGGRPETCALRPELAVFTTVGPDGAFATAQHPDTGIVLAADGGFKGVRLTVPGDVRDSDYVEFYVQDLNEGHRQVSFSAPWRVSARSCDDNCGDAAGCHPPYCGGGGGDGNGDHHGCRCLVRSDPVCSFDSCGDRCPRDTCAQKLREEPTQTPRGSSNSGGGQSGNNGHSTNNGNGTNSGGAHTFQQLHGNATGNGSSGNPTPTAGSSPSATSSHTPNASQSGQPTASPNHTPQPTASPNHTAQPTASPNHTPPPTATPTPNHTPPPTATPTPNHTPPPTPAPTPNHTPPPTAAPTPNHTPPPPPPSHPATPAQTATPAPAPAHSPNPSPTPGGGSGGPPHHGGGGGGGGSPGPTGH